jgi:hypothetical protein
MRWTILLGVLACGSSSCAFTTWRVQLPVPVVKSASPGSGRAMMGTVTDARADPRVGVKKNGFGSITANVQPTGNVAELLRSGIAQSLRDSGFDIAAEPSMKDAWRIDGRLVQLLAEPALGALTGTLHTEALLVMRVTGPDGAVYERLFAAHAEKGGIVILGESDYVTALSETLRSLVSQVIEGIRQLISARRAALSTKGWTS